MASPDQHESPNDNELTPHEDEGSHTEKKKRVRACDMCRRRKVRCDGGRAPGSKCSNCVAFKYACTYAQASKKRYTDPEYVQNLEAQLAQTQELLHKLTSRLEDSSSSSFTNPSPSTGVFGTLTPGSRSSPEADGRAFLKGKATPPGKGLTRIASLEAKENDDDDASDDEMLVKHKLEMSIQHLSLDHSRPHFLGKSSGLFFLQAALDMKEAFIGPDATTRIPLSGARPEFWTELEWTVLPDYPYPLQLFPEPALMSHLVELYFLNYNIYMPVLHRPLFEKGINEGLYLNDEGFGGIVLLVCALGAKFSDDPRVFLEGANTTHSAGWKWFKPVQASRRAIRLQHPRLYDLQLACLVAEFLHASSTPQASFTIIGEAIRASQDLGAHRRKVYATMGQADGELLKRVFWCLVSIDRALSSALGRACCIQDEDFDLEYPIECDDEYWFTDDPEKAFKQPPGKPSLISFFNSLLRLHQIHACVLRTIYATNKSKTLLGFNGPDWEHHIVMELDSSLNKWVDTVPEHLKWNPNMENLTYLNQSAFLFTTYYFLQIIIHRPYIPSPRKPSPLSFPSLAICTNAARSCIHILDVQASRSASSTYQNMMALFVSTVVLLLNVWSTLRAGTACHLLTREMTDIQKAMTMLKALESRWHTAGRVLDILCELATVGNVPLESCRAGCFDPRKPPERPTPPSTASSPSSTMSPSNGQAQSPVVSTQYATFNELRPSTSASQVSNINGISLPMHSDELGRFLLHPAFGTVVDTTPGGSVPGTWGTPGSTAPRAADGAQSTTVFGGPDAYSAFAPGAPYQATSPASSSQFSPTTQSTESTMDTTPSDAPWAAFPELLDNDTVSMWSSAPSAMVWEDWGRYIMDFGGVGNNMEPVSNKQTF